MDSTGNWPDGTPEGDPGFGPGKFGQGAVFDGDGDGINLGGVGAGSAVSVSLWIQTDTEHDTWLTDRIGKNPITDGWEGWMVRIRPTSSGDHLMFFSGNGVGRPTGP